MFRSRFLHLTNNNFKLRKMWRDRSVAGPHLILDLMSYKYIYIYIGISYFDPSDRSDYIYFVKHSFLFQHIFILTHSKC